MGINYNNTMFIVTSVMMTLTGHGYGGRAEI